MLSAKKVAATSVLGVDIGAPLVQNGSIVADDIVCAIDVGKIQTINNRSKIAAVPIIPK